MTVRAPDTDRREHPCGTDCLRTDMADNDDSDADFIEIVPVVVGSPCVNVCRIDRVSGWCEGCARTIAEITRWGKTDDSDRQAILDQLPERLGLLRARGVRK